MSSNEVFLATWQGAGRWYFRFEGEQRKLLSWFTAENEDSHLRVHLPPQFELSQEFGKSGYRVELTSWSNIQHSLAIHRMNGLTCCGLPVLRV